MVYAFCFNTLVKNGLCECDRAKHIALHGRLDFGSNHINMQATSKIPMFVSVISVSLAVVLAGCAIPKEVSAPTNAQALSVKDVVDNWVKAHKNLTELRVNSDQSVTSVQTSIKNADVMLDANTAAHTFPNAVRGTVSISAFMTPTSYNVEMRRENTSNEGPADLILNLALVEGKPIFSESHWYPDLKAYRKASTENASSKVLEDLGFDATGVGETQLPMNMFPNIASTCASAEFLQTWLGAGIKSRSDVMYKSELLENSRNYMGNMCYVLRRTVYDFEKLNRSGVIHRLKRIDHFFITQESFRLVAWTTSLADIDTEALMAGYQFVERNYIY